MFRQQRLEDSHGDAAGGLISTSLCLFRRLGRTTVTDKTALFDQCRKSMGRMGRFTLWRMNWSHSRLTDWGLAKLSIEPHSTILDVGCGGRRTVSKLAAIATQGQVRGIDYADDLDVGLVHPPTRQHLPFGPKNSNRPIATEPKLKADAQRELHDSRQVVLRGNLRSA
jgi:hypothetical protein